MKSLPFLSDPVPTLSFAAFPCRASPPFLLPAELFSRSAPLIAAARLCAGHFFAFRLVYLLLLSAKAAAVSTNPGQTPAHTQRLREGLSTGIAA
jgi:hypothetical protein